MSDAYVTNMSERIGIGRRMGALLLDAAATIGLGLVINWLEVLVQERVQALATAPASRQWRGFVVMAIVTPVFIQLAYTALEVFFAATPGKLLLKLRIAHADARPATRRQLLARWVMKNLPLIVLAGWSAWYGLAIATQLNVGQNLRTLYGLLIASTLLTLIGGLLVVTPRRQALHDRIANTAVFRDGDITAERFEAIIPPAPDPGEP